MPIKKQEFYEGAALHILLRHGTVKSIRYSAPFFVLNEKLSTYLKYSAQGRSPWGFTLTPEEQGFLDRSAAKLEIVIGFVCGADGVAAVPFEEYQLIAARRSSALHVAFFRQRGEHYEVKGPDGTLGRKVAPSDWSRLLEK